MRLLEERGTVFKCPICEIDIRYKEDLLCNFNNTQIELNTGMEHTKERCTFFSSAKTSFRRNYSYDDSAPARSSNKKR